MPIEKVMDNAKISKRNPLNLANSSVLNPINKKKANKISADVAMIASVGTNEVGNHGFMTSEYCTKLPQLPQTEASALHIPKRSATAETNPAEMANLKKSLMIVFVMFF